MNRTLPIAILCIACSASSKPPAEAPPRQQEPAAESATESTSPGALADSSGSKLERADSPCDELLTRLCADLGPDTQTCKMVKERTPEFPVARCRKLLDSYDEVVAELKQIEKQNAPITAADAAKQRAGTGPSFGPENAKVAVVVYADFECPFCSKAAETLTKLKERYGKTVRFVYRHYPLPMHPNAELAAQASLAAHAQKKFWKYH